MSTDIKNLSTAKKQLFLTALDKAVTKANRSNGAAQNLYDQLLTEGEKVTLGRRILAAQMILRGDSRREICGELNMSPNMVAGVRTWLESEMPGYAKTVVERPIQNMNNQSPSNSHVSYDQTTLAGMRQKYPLHFLLFNQAENLLAQLKKLS